MKMDKENILATRVGKTIYRDKDKVYKVFDSQYSMSNILNEALNHARVMESNVKVPKIYGVTEVDGKVAIVLQYIEGKTLAELMKEHPEKIDQYLEQFVDLQMTIQSKKVPLLNRQYDKFYKKISDSNFDATTKYDLHARLDSMKKHDKLCHGDFNPSNIIITKEHESYIICLLYTSPSPRDRTRSRMPSSA